MNRQDAFKIQAAGHRSFCIPVTAEVIHLCRVGKEWGVFDGLRTLPKSFDAAVDFDGVKSFPSCRAAECAAIKLIGTKGYDWKF